MSNIISLIIPARAIEKDFSASNGLTTVMIVTLVLSGSRIAKSEREKDLVLWFASKDQEIIGTGTLELEVTKMPWKKEGFEEEKQFLLRMIDGVLARTGWEVLNWKPNEDSLFWALRQLYEFIEEVTIDDIDPSIYKEWEEIWKEEQAEGKEKFVWCKTHGVWKCWGQCAVWNGRGITMDGETDMASCS